MGETIRILAWGAGIRICIFDSRAAPWATKLRLERARVFLSNGVGPVCQFSLLWFSLASTPFLFEISVFPSFVVKWGWSRLLARADFCQILCFWKFPPRRPRNLGHVVASSGVAPRPAYFCQMGPVSFAGQGGFRQGSGSAKIEVWQNWKNRSKNARNPSQSLRARRMRTCF